jgi:hypothetical protein
MKVKMPITLPEDVLQAVERIIGGSKKGLRSLKLLYART